MDKLRVCFDREGNTLSVWFDDPKKEHLCEESDDDLCRRFRMRAALSEGWMRNCCTSFCGANLALFQG